MTANAHAFKTSAWARGGLGAHPSGGQALAHEPFNIKNLF